MMKMSVMDNNTVFMKWLDNVEDKKIKKYFGDVSRTEITVQNCVKNIVETVAFFFKAKIEAGIPSSSGKSKKVKVGEKHFLKTKFYKFMHPAIDPAYWKGKGEVPLYDSIKPVTCDTCTTGAIKCKACGGSGHQDCNKCKGTGKLKCKRCGGAGKIENKLQIIERGATSEEKKKIIYDTVCPLCHGLGTATCPSCNGFGKNTCKKCKGLGSSSCKNCGGSGYFYQYELVPVPFGRSSAKATFKSYFIYSPEIEKILEKNLEENMKLIDGIKVNDLNELKENLIQQVLGTYSSNIDKRIKKTQQLFEKLEKKDASQNPLYPILVIPAIELEIETPINKKFTIIGLGTSDNFTTFAPRF